MCIATITDDGYLPGTLVLLSSFLRCNPLFRGDIVVIHDGLSEEGKARLEHFPNLRFHTIASAFKARLAPLSADPHLSRALPRFYSLEAFNLPGYDRILALDSDILCQGSVAELVEMDAALEGHGLVFTEQVQYRRGSVRSLSRTPKALGGATSRFG
jgi:lipopolysaccharide biosynthesis glycosyltransferase